MSLRQRIIALIVLFVVVVGGVLLYVILTKSPAAEVQGEVTIIVLDRDGSEIERRIVDFYEGDTFVIILQSTNLNFAFSEPHPEYGVRVISILNHTLGSTEWWNHDHNGVMSNFGVSSQPFADGDIFTFQIKDWS